MPAITFSEFDAGLDVSRDASVAGANQLRDLTNAYVTTGKAIRKRPGLRKVATLETGTVGLVAGLGKLNTFYGDTAVTHANTLFEAHKLPFPGSAKEIAQIHAGEVFLGALYVVAEFADGSIRHFYLDDPGAWEASTEMAVGNRRRPTVAGDFQLEVTAITNTNKTGATEPTWSTTLGDTTTDGDVTWKTVSLAIDDAKCPNSKSALITASKVFAVDGDVVRFSATNAPRDWTTASDAGFLPTGLQTSSSSDAMALGRFRKYLAVFQRDAVQVWNVDPDPANMSLFDTIEGIGTQYPRAVGNLAGDIYFLSDLGFRSVTLLTATGNLKDIDVGTPIDSLVRQSLRDADANTIPVALFYPAQGQYICVVGDVTWVYTFSRTAKISAWSKYGFRGVSVDAAATLDGTLYLRDGDIVYAMDDQKYTDDGLSFEVSLGMAYLDFKAPGVLKQVFGVDAVVTGTADVSFAFDPNDTSLVTEAVPLAKNTQPKEMTPVEIASTSISPLIAHQADEAFELSALNVYFEKLGPV